jgi:hypothetical protein
MPKASTATRFGACLHTAAPKHKRLLLAPSFHFLQPSTPGQTSKSPQDRRPFLKHSSLRFTFVVLVTAANMQGSGALEGMILPPAAHVETVES